MKRILFFSIFIILFLFPTLLVHSEEELEVKASSAILMESTSGRVLYEKNGNEQRPVASISKIMTAIVAIENAPLGDYVKISHEATLQIGSSVYLKEGDQIKLEDLIYALLLRSGNDAAYAIAEYVGGDVNQFVLLMNEKAKELGMYNSVFGNPSGLDETTKNISTAYDMALLTSYAMNNPLYREINNTTIHKATTLNEQVYVWKNKHKLINRYDYVIGGKTGYTTLAKRTLVTVAKKNNIELIAVTLNDPDDWLDHMNLFDYGFSEYKMSIILKKGIFEVKALEKIFYVDENILYPMKKDEYNLYQLIIDYEESEQKAVVYLVKDKQIVYQKEVSEYDTSHSDLKKSFTIEDLGQGVMEFIRDMSW